MMQDLPTLQLLLRELQQVPYLASKNLYRVAHYFLQMDERKMQQFCHILQETKNKLVECSQCCVWQEKDRQCNFCTSPKRNQRLICLVETWHDVYALEKTGAYQGSYHVLGGVLYPLEGIGPEDLTIELLYQRVMRGCDELILALNQTPEGEMTAMFIAKKLEGLPVKITCLARGVSVGSRLEFTDKLTLLEALMERRPF